MKMPIIILLLYFTYNVFGQAMTEDDIARYVKKIDGLKSKNKLERIFYPNMSACGGGLHGYYYDGKLILIDATYQAEVGFSQKTIYLKDSAFVRIIYREYFAEWGKYEQQYPSDKYEWDPKKMTYTDTLYVISLSQPINFIKKAQKKIVSKKVDQNLIDELVLCGEEMKRELAEELQTRGR